MGKIYLIKEQSKKFASFITLGTFDKSEWCKVCKRPSYDQPILVEPLIMEWIESSDVIGDFSYNFTKIVIKENVKQFLINKSYECSFGKVQINPSAENVKSNIVKFPYIGSPLFWLKPNNFLNINPEVNQLKIKYECNKCGTKIYLPPLENIVITKSEIKNYKLFSIKQFHLAYDTYVTDEGLELIKSQTFSNFGYREVGWIE